MDDKVKVVAFSPLTLYKNDKEVKDTYASLTWSIRNGYPRATVYTESTKERTTAFDYDKLIVAPMDAVTINTFLDSFSSVITGKVDKFSIKCFNTKYVNNERTDDVILQSTLMCGKDANGVIYLCIVADNKKKVKFDLMPNSKWHVFVDNNGTEITDAKVLSVKHATAYHARLKSLMDKYILDDTIIKYTDKKNPSHSDDSALTKLF